MTVTYQTAPGKIAEEAYDVERDSAAKAEEACIRTVLRQCWMRLPRALSPRIACKSGLRVVDAQKGS